MRGRDTDDFHPWPVTVDQLKALSNSIGTGPIPRRERLVDDRHTRCIRIIGRAKRAAVADRDVERVEIAFIHVCRADANERGPRRQDHTFRDDGTVLDADAVHGHRGRECDRPHAGKCARLVFQLTVEAFGARGVVAGKVGIERGEQHVIEPVARATTELHGEASIEEHGDREEHERQRNLS